MAKIENIRTVHDYNAYIGQADEHPLVSVIDYSEVSPIRHSLNNYSIFGLFLREDTLVDLTYGCGQYAYDECTLICVAPGQVGGKEDNGDTVELKGWALLFHPELLRGTFLEDRMRRYTFFSYNVNEALHMTHDERDTLVQCFKMLKNELSVTSDAHQNAIIVSIIDVVLQYCMRFYARQFSAHHAHNSDILTRFELFLNKYFDTQRQLREGLPSVQQCASELCLSGNYFTDLIKRQTGLTPKEHINRFIIAQAKNRLTAGDTVSQVAFGLGFEYSQHFCRLFKKMEGRTPTEYIAMIKSRRP